MPTTHSILCPLHRRREAFTPPILQPLDNRLVRYPCGHIEGLTDMPERATRDKDSEHRMRELEDKVGILREQVRHLSARQAPQAAKMKALPEIPADPGLSQRYQKEI